MDEQVNIEKTYSYWIARSDKDFDTMIHLYDSRDYHWSLFIGHIVIERLLKACVVRSTKKHAPFTHDLTKLADLSGRGVSGLVGYYYNIQSKRSL